MKTQEDIQTTDQHDKWFHEEKWLLRDSIEILEGSLALSLSDYTQKVLEYFQFERTQIALAVVIFRLYWHEVISDQMIYLGSIQLRKRSDGLSEVILIRVPGKLKARYETAVKFWKDSIALDRAVLKVVQETDQKSKQATVRTGESENSKQKGRYRLSLADIRYRKGVVKQANVIFKREQPITWKQIADRLEIPERTLRDWRHNPTYK